MLRRFSRVAVLSSHCRGLLGSAASLKSPITALRSIRSASRLARMTEETPNYGFDRPEMGTEPLAGTVDPYERHLLVGTGTSNWAQKIESEGLGLMFAESIKAHKDSITAKIRLTATDDEAGLVTVFPERSQYKVASESDVASIVTKHLVAGQVCEELSVGVTEQKHIYVCCHFNRDQRCGTCGPQLVEKLHEVIAARGLKDIAVHRCSHIGGHKYAGNVIVYSRKLSNGNLAGDWYGYVTPDDIETLLEGAATGGKPHLKLWRGRMGATKDVQKQEGVCEGCDCGRKQ